MLDFDGTAVRRAVVVVGRHHDLQVQLCSVDQAVDTKHGNLSEGSTGGEKALVGRPTDACDLTIRDAQRDGHIARFRMPHGNHAIGAARGQQQAMTLEGEIVDVGTVIIPDQRPRRSARRLTVAAISQPDFLAAAGR